MLKHQNIELDTLRNPNVLFKLTLPYLGLIHTKWRFFNAVEVKLNCKRARPFYDYICRQIENKKDLETALQYTTMVKAKFDDATRNSIANLLSEYAVVKN